MTRFFCFGDVRLGVLGCLLFFYSGILAHSFEHDVVYLSNSPESILYPGLILSTQLESKSLRLMYHHRNASTSPFYVSVILSNPTSKPAEVKLVYGLGGSSEDVVFAGHKAMVSFMQGVLTPSDSIVIAPNSSVSFPVHKIKPSQTVSGLLRVERLTQRPIGIKVSVVDEEYPQLSPFMDIGSVWEQFRVVEFEHAYKTIQETITIPSENYSLRIGGQPYLVDVRTRQDVKGNYGRFYDLSFALDNTSSVAQRVRGYVMPLKKGGVDRGVFIVNGVLKEIGILRYSDTVVQSEEFLDVVVPAMSKKMINIMTMPQAGCFYPIEMSFKVVP